MAKARLAQSAERKAPNLVVVGSSPTVGVFRKWVCGCASKAVDGANHRHGKTAAGMIQVPAVRSIRINFSGLLGATESRCNLQLLPPVARGRTP